MTHLTCCAGVDAERFNRTGNHTRVFCSACGGGFCMDTRDVNAEAEHHPDRFERAQGKARRWYCSEACQNVGRRQIGVNASEAQEEARRLNAAKALAARLGTLVKTESRETLF